MMIDAGLRWAFALQRGGKRGLQVAADLVLVAIMFTLALVLRLESAAWLVLPDLAILLLAVGPATLVFFWGVGLYRAIVRSVTSAFVVTACAGAVLSASFMLVVARMADLPLPGSVPWIYAVLLLGGVCGLRLAARALGQRLQDAPVQDVIVYGAGSAGRQLLHGLRQSTRYRPRAFVDDDPALNGERIGGCTVFAPSSLPQLCARWRVETVLLAMPSVDRARRKTILRQLQDLNVRVLTMPGLDDLASGRQAAEDLRGLSADDLLGRDAVPPRADLLSAKITGRTVLVTGAGGSIGAALCEKLIAARPKALILLDASEYALYTVNDALLTSGPPAGTEVVPVLGSVQDEGTLSHLFHLFSVDTVFHAAAYKHVPLVEQNSIEGVKNNVFGTWTLIQAARTAGVRDFTLISTDKAVRPTNLMGASKRMAELICQAVADVTPSMRISMVRFGNVLGSSGSVIPRFDSQIRRGGPVTVTHPEVTRYFMTIAEAADLVIQAGAMAKGGEVFVLDMGEPVRIRDLAERMIRLHGLKPFSRGHGSENGDIEIAFSGLRPGEKLYEELLIGNATLPTAHPRIKSASEISLPFPKLAAHLDDLAEACRQNDVLRLREVLLQAGTGLAPSPGVQNVLWTGPTAGEALTNRKPAISALG